MFKKFIFSFFLLFFSLASQSFATTIPLEYFGRDDCAHCQDQKIFLEKLTEKHPDLSVKYYNVKNKEDKELFKQVTEKAELSKTTPLTFLGNTFIQGFKSENTTGVQFEKIINRSLFQDNLTIPEYLVSDGSFELQEVSGGTCSAKKEDVSDCDDDTLTFDLPIFGVVNFKDFSLNSLSVILGFIDGFNPCAMWVLIMFLMVLSQIGSKKRMFQIAGIFIFAEAVMYYLILNVWMTTWDFVGLDQLVTPIIGTIAIGGGIFFLYEAWKSDGTCQVTNHEQRKKISQRIQDLANSPLTIISFFGILALAFSVNIIEFACSIGIPQAFTKVLDLNMLSWIAKQWYMFLYILFYMIDDLIVFAIAIYSIEKLHSMHNYTKITNFIGGILMLIIGALMIFNPAMLVL